MRVLLIALTIAGLSGPVQATVLDTYTATYQVEFSGLGGDLVSSLSRDESGNFVYENRTRARGLARLARPRDIVDRSLFTVDNDRLVPLHFSSEDGTRRNKDGNDVTFDWHQGRARSMFEGDMQEFEIENGLLDRQLLQLALMRDLAAGVESTSYAVIDRSHIKTYAVEVVARETVSVPAGDFETVKVRKQRDGSSRATLLWCAPALGYLPVLMHQLKDDKVIARLELVETG